jgi:hypothetical protein
MQGMAANSAWLIIKWQSWRKSGRTIKTFKHVKLVR